MLIICVYCCAYTCLNTVKPVLSDHIKQDIVLAFRTSGCLLLHESSAFSNKQPVNHLSIAISMSPEWMVA